MASTITTVRLGGVSSPQWLQTETPRQDGRKDCGCVPTYSEGARRNLVTVRLGKAPVALRARHSRRPNLAWSQDLADSTTRTPYLSLLPSFGAENKIGRRVGSRRHVKNSKALETEGGEGEPLTVAEAVQKFFAEMVWPYARLARLDKPVGICFFIFLPYWTISLASPAGSFPDPKLLGLFGLLGLLNRSAGCTINDIVDMDLDAKVERSKTRPLPSGAITRAQGIGFYAAQLLLVGALLLRLNDTARLLMLVYIPLYSLYPLMKRLTDLPQAYLSLCIAWPLLAGWAAVVGGLDQPAAFIPPFLSTVFWMFVADTMYAHADKKDDAVAGVRSTARLFGDYSKLWMSAMYVVCAGSLGFTGVNNGLGWPFYAGAAAALSHLAWTVAAVDLDNPKDCISKFAATSWLFSPLVFAAITLGRLT